MRHTEEEAAPESLGRGRKGGRTFGGSRGNGVKARSKRTGGNYRTFRGEGGDVGSRNLFEKKWTTH